jgi:uncharacterized protein
LLLTQSDKTFFQQCLSELAGNKDVQSMDTFIQHGDVSTLEHSVSVAYVSLWLSEKLNLRVDRSSLVRGALLHDFFLYDWHIGNGQKGLHGFTHPRTALENAEARFQLTEREKNIILRHMWPLTPIPPKYREAYLVTVADKYCSLVETLRKHTVYPYKKTN